MQGEIQEAVQEIRENADGLMATIDEGIIEPSAGYRPIYIAQMLVMLGSVPAFGYFIYSGPASLWGIVPFALIALMLAGRLIRRRRQILQSGEGGTQ